MSLYERVYFYSYWPLYISGVNRFTFLCDGNLALALKFNSCLPYIVHVFAPVINKQCPGYFARAYSFIGASFGRHG